MGRRELPSTCAFCAGTMEGKRMGAVFCSKKCKQRATERTRSRDDAARYLVERDRRIAYATAYAKANPHVGQATKNRRKALQRAAGVFLVSPADWLRMCARFQFLCAYCGQPGPLTMDHVVPLSRGGRHSIGNIVPACASCNASKSNRLVMEWRVKRRSGVPCRGKLQSQA